MSFFFFAEEQADAAVLQKAIEGMYSSMSLTYSLSNHFQNITTLSLITFLLLLSFLYLDFFTAPMRAF